MTLLALILCAISNLRFLPRNKYKSTCISLKSTLSVNITTCLKGIKVLEKAKGNNLAKHTAAIHISNDITAVDRKVYNLLLKNASLGARKGGAYEINIRDIAKDLGYSHSKNYLFIEEIVQKLVDKSITFNLLKKDNKKKWGGSISMLAEAIPDAGVIRYSFPPMLESSFSNPNIYANLNLDYQRNLSSKYSLALWEYCTEQLDRNKKSTLVTDKMSLSVLKTLLGAEEDCYNQFKYLNQRVIKKSVLEINEVTDINLEVNFHKDNGKSVTDVSFNVSRKKAVPHNKKQNELFEIGEPNIIDYIMHNVIDPQDLEISARELGLSADYIDSLLKDHEMPQVNKALQIVLDKVNQGDKIGNIPGYIWALLEKGVHDNISSDKIIASSDQVKEEVSKQKLLELEAAIFGDDPRVASFFEKLQAHYDVHIYRNWLLHLRFARENDEVVEFDVKTKFIKEWLDDNYAKTILKCWQAVNSQIKAIQIFVNKEL